MLTRSPSRSVFWGLFTLSCLAHVVVFGLPLSQRQVERRDDSSIAAVTAESTPVEGDESIAITTLPPGTLAAELSHALPLAAVAPLREQEALSPQAIAPQSVEKALPAQPLPAQPSPLPVADSTHSLLSPAEPEPQALDDSQRGLLELGLVDPGPSEPAPSESSQPESSQPESSQPESSQPEPAMVVAVGDDFPHLAGAQGNCYNLASCYRLGDAGGYRQAAKALTEQMQAQGYAVSERDDIDSAGRRVFEVVMPGQPNDIYFLNVFSDEAGSAVYVMTMDILTLQELQQLRV
ncbi:MAG: hypothetical protein AAFP03_08435 [Cyanobacteria bacterium J06598_3]